MIESCTKCHWVGNLSEVRCATGNFDRFSSLRVDGVRVKFFNFVYISVMN